MGSSLSDVKTIRSFDDHKLIAYINDDSVGLEGFVAIHRGNGKVPAFGATRFWDYKTGFDAMEDAVRLAKTMSYKAALAGLKCGGGKATLISKKLIGDRKNYLLNVLNHFLYEQRSRTREHWYQDLIKKMMNYQLFRELWPQALKHIETDIDLTNYGEKTLNTKKGYVKIILNLKFFVLPIFKDPRFLVELYIPSDLHTMNYYQKK